MIDIHTFILALGVGNIAFALLMACYMHGAVDTPGLRDWMLGRLIVGFGQCGWCVAPDAGVHLRDTLSLCLWIGGVLLEVSAYCRFFGMRKLHPTMAVITAAAAGTVAVALAHGASRIQLLWIVAFLTALFAFGAALALLRPGANNTLLQRVIGINDGLFALAIWAWLFIEKGSVDPAALSPIHVMAYLTSYLLMIVTGFGFLLICKQKDDLCMQHLATIDGLTGTLNRRAFFERTDGAHQLTVRLRQPMALLMLDLDHFKQLNDRFGHACGDHALRLFGEVARGILRDHDLLGRLGGEEFGLALPGTTLDGACRAAERLRAAIEAAPLSSCAGEYRMSASIGVVMVEPNETLTAALARADHALYAAKSGGRNRVEVGPAMLKRA